MSPQWLAAVPRALPPVEAPSPRDPLPRRYTTSQISVALKTYAPRTEPRSTTSRSATSREVSRAESSPMEEVEAGRRRDRSLPPESAVNSIHRKNFSCSGPSRKEAERFSSRIARRARGIAARVLARRIFVRDLHNGARSLWSRREGGERSTEAKSLPARNYGGWLDGPATFAPGRGARPLLKIGGRARSARPVRDALAMARRAIDLCLEPAHS